MIDRVVLITLLGAITLLGWVPASAQVQVVVYSADQATQISVATGYAVLVELSSDERIENVVVGDSGSWQVTPTKLGDQLVIKPTNASSATDLVVTTSGRRYIFMLQPSGITSANPFVIRFEYPDAKTVAAGQSATIARYRFRGARDLFPTEMTDDGGRTMIVWKSGISLPAIYALDNENHETLVNARMVGQTYVIEGTAVRYVFRRDKAKATAARQIPKVRY